MEHGYNYTRPRGPISAMYASPGPCYMLPTLTGYILHDPRSVHPMAPAWIIGAKISERYDRPGPGPAGYLPDPKMLNSGWDGAPHWSICTLVKPLVPFNVPGPPHYKRELVS